MARLDPDERKEQIIIAATKLARRHGYQHVKRADVADAAGVANSLVSAYWGTMTQLKRAIMRRAIQREDLAIIAQGLACGDRQARKAPKELQEKAALSLTV